MHTCYNLCQRSNTLRHVFKQCLPGKVLSSNPIEPGSALSSTAGRLLVTSPLHSWHSLSLSSSIPTFITEEVFSSASLHPVSITCTPSPLWPLPSCAWGLWVLPSLFFFFIRIPIPGSPQTHYVARNDVQFLILLSPTPKCWDYKPEPSCPAFVVLKTKLRALCLSTLPTDLHPQPSSSPFASRV